MRHLVHNVQRNESLAVPSLNPVLLTFTSEKLNKKFENSFFNHFLYRYEILEVILYGILLSYFLLTLWDIFVYFLVTLIIVKVAYNFVFLFRRSHLYHYYFVLCSYTITLVLMNIAFNNSAFVFLFSLCVQNSYIGYIQFMLVMTLFLSIFSYLVKIIISLFVSYSFQLYYVWFFCVDVFIGSLVVSLLLYYHDKIKKSRVCVKLENKWERRKVKLRKKLNERLMLNLVPKKYHHTKYNEMDNIICVNVKLSGLEKKFEMDGCKVMDMIKFDYMIVKKHKMLKNKYFGDNFVCFCDNFDLPDAPIKMCVDLIDIVKSINRAYEKKLSIKMGIATGSGDEKKVFFELFGQAPRLAEILQRSCDNFKMHITSDLNDMICGNYLSYENDKRKYYFDSEIKKTYFIEDESSLDEMMISRSDFNKEEEKDDLFPDITFDIVMDKGGLSTVRKRIDEKEKIFQFPMDKDKREIFFPEYFKYFMFQNCCFWVIFTFLFSVPFMIINYYCLDYELKKSFQVYHYSYIGLFLMLVISGVVAFVSGYKNRYSLYVIFCFVYFILFVVFCLMVSTGNNHFHFLSIMIVLFEFPFNFTPIFSFLSVSICLVLLVLSHFFKCWVYICASYIDLLGQIMVVLLFFVSMFYFNFMKRRYFLKLFYYSKRYEVKLKNRRAEKEKNNQLLSCFMPWQLVSEWLNSLKVTDLFCEKINICIICFLQIDEIVCEINTNSFGHNEVNLRKRIRIMNDLFMEFDFYCKEKPIFINYLRNKFMFISKVDDDKRDMDYYAAFLSFLRLVLKQLQNFNSKEKVDINYRIGFTSGSVLFGVFGLSALSFAFLGESIDIAHDLAKTSDEKRIQFRGKDAYNSIYNSENCFCAKKEMGIDAKEQTYFLTLL